MNNENENNQNENANTGTPSPSAIEPKKTEASTKKKLERKEPAKVVESKKPLVKTKITPPAKKVPEATKNGIPTKGSGKLSQTLCDLLLKKQYTDEEIIAQAKKKHPEKRIDLIIVNHYRRLVNAEGKKVEKLFKVKGKGLVPKNKLTIEEKHALGVRK